MNSSSPSGVRFFGSKLKIERAKKHINDLNAAIAEFGKLNPYVSRVEAHENPGLCNLVIRVKKTLPTDIVLILGDAIHNLRSALDLLACDLVRPFTNGDTKAVYFPFGDNPNDFEGRIAKRKIDRTTPEIVNKMRSLKAYPGGNDALHGLHRLDITDKHVSMIDVMTMGELPTVTTNNFIFANNRMSINDGARFIEGIGFGPHAPYVGYERNLSFEILLANGLPFHHQSVVPTLIQLTELVENIVAKFEALP